MGPSGHIGYILHILDCLGQVYAGTIFGQSSPYKGDSARFSKVARVTRPPLVFRGLTGSQRTPEFWGVTDLTSYLYFFSFLHDLGIFLSQYFIPIS